MAWLELDACGSVYACVKLYGCWMRALLASRSVRGYGSATLSTLEPSPGEAHHSGSWLSW